MPAPKQATDWQPIETAPKDGSNLLVVSANGRAMRIARFNGMYGWQVTPGQWSITPTHWMQLPEPPDVQI